MTITKEQRLYKQYLTAFAIYQKAIVNRDNAEKEVIEIRIELDEIWDKYQKEMHTNRESNER